MYTLQAKTKKQNHQSEYLLHDVKMLSAIAHSLGKDLVYLAAEITCLWKLMCLNQFHNMIPGSSIEMVFEDSDKIYVDIL
ncbi:Glycoside hydrolase, 38 vacuolar alpha mannosidase, partial [Coemansia erecta]